MEWLRRVLDRVSHQPSRADALAVLRRRLAAFPSSAQSRGEERELAETMRRLRVGIAGMLRDVRSCRSCAKGCPMPQGQWDGGFCCSGETEEIFSDDELASLAAAGVSWRMWQAPQGPHAGCVFRGAFGCSLVPEARPNLCLHYICRELSHELAKRGEFEAIDACCTALIETFRTFVVLRRGAQDPATEASDRASMP